MGTAAAYLILAQPVDPGSTTDVFQALVLVAAIGLPPLVLFFVVRAAILSARKKRVSEQ